MNFFKEQEFPPPNLCPKSQIFAANYKKITKKFFKQVKEQDFKMWQQASLCLIDRKNFDHPHNDALNLALNGILQQLISTSTCWHRRIEVLGEMLNMDLPIFPFDSMNSDVKSELIDMAQVSFEYYRALQEIQAFMLEE